MQFLRYLSVSVVAVVLVATAAAEKKTDIEYGRVGNERLLLDVHVPDGTGPHPVAILIHGGGWSGGDKSGSNKPGDGADISPWFEVLSPAKYVWFSINYRLAPQHRWPSQMEDVRTAIDWVRTHAAEYKGDPSRIVVFGHSAGGHLAALAGTEPGAEKRIRAVVGFAPVTDLVSDTERRGGASPSLQNLFGVTKELTPETRKILADCSPLSYVRKGMPPVLIVHGDQDKTVPLTMSQAYIARLRELGVEAELIVRPGVPHSLVAGEKIDTAYREKMLEWLRAALM